MSLKKHEIMINLSKNLTKRLHTLNELLENIQNQGIKIKLIDRR